MRGGRGFHQLVREALRDFLDRLEARALARRMADGYRAEAESPSLHEDWSTVETDDIAQARPASRRSLDRRGSITVEGGSAVEDVRRARLVRGTEPR